MACRRSLVVLSRNSRPVSILPGSNVLPSSRRQLAVAADGNVLSERDHLPPSMALSAQDLTGKDIQSTTGEVGFGVDDVRIPRSVQLAYLRPLKRTAQYRIPTCNLQLRSFSVRNLEFFTTFALRAAYYLNLPAVGPIPLPKQIKRWTVPKGHFVHKKSQENFERITLRRLIQIQDGHPETVQMWLAYLRKRSYYGVGMKANVWSFEKLGLGREMDIAAEEGQSLEQRWTSGFPSQELTPEVQAEVDQWMKEHAPGETLVSSNEHHVIPEQQPTSISTRIDEILAQVEQEAAVAEERSAIASENGQENGADQQQPVVDQKIAEQAVPSVQDNLPEESTVQSSTSQEAEQTSQADEAPLEAASVTETATMQEDAAVAEPAQTVAEPNLKEEPLTTQETSSITDSQIASSETTTETSSEAPAEISSAPSAPPGEPEKSAETTSTPSPLDTSSPSTTENEPSKKATKSTAKRGRKPSLKTAPQAEEKTPPASKEDTSKNPSTPEEADPAVTPQTEKAKEAEAEDAAQPLGDLPKTPS